MSQEPVSRELKEELKKRARRLKRWHDRVERKKRTAGPLTKAARMDLRRAKERLIEELDDPVLRERRSGDGIPEEVENAAEELMDDRASEVLKDYWQYVAQAHDRELDPLETFKQARKERSDPLQALQRGWMPGEGQSEENQVEGQSSQKSQDKDKSSEKEEKGDSKDEKGDSKDKREKKNRSRGWRGR